MPPTTPETKYPEYQVATQLYEGPLDLLLQLIERAELDVTKLALSQVTDQFLHHMKEMEDQSPSEVSAFLVIASRLMQIKSEALLPRLPEREVGEEDPGDALIQQLMAYKRYKEIAEFMAEREENRLHTYLRLASPPKVEGKLDLSNVTLIDLANAAMQAYIRSDRINAIEAVVKLPKITIREKISFITKALRSKEPVSFYTLLENRKNRTEIVVTFLAMLELIKRFMVTANQESRFGDIELIPLENIESSSDFELEFAE